MVQYREKVPKPEDQVLAMYPDCVILTPSRELCNQVLGSISTVFLEVPLVARVTAGQEVFKDYRFPQTDILITTPAWLHEHGNKNFLQSVRHIVLDEADLLLGIFTHTSVVNFRVLAWF